jgi:HD superfamily phosphohydrolase YqeK
MDSRSGDQYEDSHDMIERIRRLRQAAERKMNAFGDISDYDVRVIHGPQGESGTQREFKFQNQSVIGEKQ